MPSDASIYGMIQPLKQQGPLELYGQMAQVKNLMGAGQLQDLQRSELERGIAEEGKIRDLFSRGNVRPEELMAISPKRGMEFQKSQLEQKKAQGEIDKNAAETAAKNVKMLRDSTASVQNDAGLALLRERTASLFGPDIASQIPQSTSLPGFAEWQRKAIMDSDAFLDRVSPKPPAGHSMRPDGSLSPVDPEYLRGRTAIAAAGQTPAWDSERGIWITPPGAAPQPGAGPAGPASPNAPQNLPPRASDVTGMRKEFNDLPEVRNFRATVPIFNSALKAPDTRAGDIQFAYTIGKIFDPNSVVREGELKLVGEAATVLEKFQGELRTLTEGKGRLTPQTRRELLETARARVKELEAAQGAVRKAYESQAKARNLPFDQIFADMPAVGDIPTVKPAANFTPEQIDAELRRRGVIK
jgi:hypothetical protein